MRALQLLTAETKVKVKPRGENGLAQTWSEEQEERIVNPSVQAP